MKIFVNRKIRRSPWGGGSHFLSSFVDYAAGKGHKITTSYDEDVDVIFMIDPRPDEGFGDVNQLLAYKTSLLQRGRKVKVIHRINDTDVARNTNFLVDLNMSANAAIADKTIFISQWLKQHYEKAGFCRDSVVIKNGCNQRYFYPNPAKKTSTKTQKIKVVTHHWSDNFNKGFDAYIELDKRLRDRSDIEFTYIGRYYKEYQPTSTRVISPLYGIDLGNELRRHDIYLTAAKWEACGMHHIEAASCGLPIVYHRDGGGINEICKNYGIEINANTDICDAIITAFSQKDELVSYISYQDLSSDTVNEMYIKIFEECLTSVKKQIFSLQQS